MIYCAHCREQIGATPDELVPYVHLRSGHGRCDVQLEYPLNYPRYATPDRKRITIENIGELISHEQPRRYEAKEQ